MHKGKKYELAEETKTSPLGIGTVTRIRALRTIRNPGMPLIRAGDLGGFVSSEKNLSQEGECWVDYDAYVLDDAKVSEDALISGNGKVRGYAQVKGKAVVTGEARVDGYATVCGQARVQDRADIQDQATVKRNAVVKGMACVYGIATVTEDASAGGIAVVAGDTVLRGNVTVEDGVYYITPDKKVKPYPLEDVSWEAFTCNSCKCCCYCEETQTLRCYVKDVEARPVAYVNRRTGERTPHPDVMHRRYCIHYIHRSDREPIKVFKTYSDNINYLTEIKPDGWLKRCWKRLVRIMLKVIPGRTDEDKLRNCKK